MNKHILIGAVVILVVVGIMYGTSRTKNAEAPTDVPGGASEEQPVGAPELQPTSSIESETPSANVPQPSPVTTARPAPEVRLPYTATVVYNGTEFVPEEVTIIEGGTVTFVNQSNEKMWIATDNHPMHNIYPIKDEASCSGNTFDQCTSVGKGGTWSFTFDRLGTWRYHNHSLAVDRGSVRVMTVEDYKRMLTKDKPEWMNN